MRRKKKKMQQTTHPPSPLPYDAKAFHQPNPDELAQNAPYWQGYSTGQQVCTGIPGPAGSGSYDNYRSWVNPCLLPPDTEGFPNAVAVGYNNALIDWCNYLWTNDPQSPHKVPPA